MTTTTTISATPAKLRDGTWGARVQGAVEPGAVIEIRARSGKTWRATVERVVWSGEGVSLVRTEARRSRAELIARDEMCYRGHRQPVRGCWDCHDTFDC